MKAERQSVPRAYSAEEDREAVEELAPALVHVMRLRELRLRADSLHRSYKGLTAISIYWLFIAFARNRICLVKLSGISRKLE